MMMKEAEAQRGRYASLELDLRTKTAAYADYHTLKRRVIMADATAHLAFMPKYSSLALALNLDRSAEKELQTLYSDVINPLSKTLFYIRRDFIGIRADSGFGANIQVNPRPSEQAMDSAAKRFTDFFFNLSASEGLDDKKAIKRVVVYPLMISVISVWGRHDQVFADKLIDSIMAREGDPDLRKAIEMLYLR